VLSLGAMSQLFGIGIGKEGRCRHTVANGITEAKRLLLSVLIHQWQYSLVDCLIKCNQLPVDEHTTQFAFIVAQINNPSHAYTDHNLIVV